MSYFNCGRCGAPVKKTREGGVTNGLCDNCNEDEDYWDEEPEEDDFQPCDECDLPDACADYGCAIKAGLKINLDY